MTTLSPDQLADAARGVRALSDEERAWCVERLGVDLVVPATWSAEQTSAAIRARVGAHYDALTGDTARRDREAAALAAARAEGAAQEREACLAAVAARRAAYTPELEHGDCGEWAFDDALAAIRARGTEGRADTAAKSLRERTIAALRTVATNAIRQCGECRWNCYWCAATESGFTDNHMQHEPSCPVAVLAELEREGGR